MKSFAVVLRIIILLVMLPLVGCAPTAMIQNGTASLGTQPLDINVRPHESLGVKVTPNLLAGDVTVLEGPLPDEVLGEEYPGRIRWNGWGVDPQTGREYLVQFVRSGMYRTGEYMYAIIIDGNRKEISPRMRIISLGSMGNYASTLSGKTFKIEKSMFLADKEYRAKAVLENGTEIGERHEILDFATQVKSWNLYSIPEGQIYSPMGEDDVKRIIRINPSYGLGERIIAKGHITISHPVYMVASVALSVIEAMNAPTEGWDYSSTLPTREVMAAIIAYTNQPRLALIKKLNIELKKKV
ncbi:MAG: hypothetical protein WC823_01105 [Parcubacteria group bacterium]|jgi:hypothetical protein